LSTLEELNIYLFHEMSLILLVLAIICFGICLILQAWYMGNATKLPVCVAIQKTSSSNSKLDLAGQVHQFVGRPTTVKIILLSKTINLPTSFKTLLFILLIYRYIFNKM